MPDIPFLYAINFWTRQTTKLSAVATAHVVSEGSSQLLFQWANDIMKHASVTDTHLSVAALHVEVGHSTSSDWSVCNTLTSGNLNMYKPG